MTVARIRNRKYSPEELPKPGDVFGRLTVLYKSRLQRKRGESSTRFTCLCSCGKKTRGQFWNLRKGLKKSCGCLQRDSTRTHGMTKSPELTCWKNMIQRCLNPKSPAWEGYGGRGITVCGRWLCSFPKFLEDMGKRPSRRHSLERTNVNGNYEPGNCKWATRK
jgi:hypothetical protein